jgi:hypothetical protein
MIDFNELKSQVNSAVNNEPQDNADADQIDAIASTINSLPGFNLSKGDDLDSVDYDVFWDIVEKILDGKDYDIESTEDWRAEE